ncbi:MAG: hypothetical protein JWM87_3452 [Candidatus Eremiobacteraeota bacterium]|nr:hypothetical protein [Candidatus Eremiobacteraeota bacterium]
MQQRLVSSTSDYFPLAVPDGAGVDAVRYGNMVHEHSQIPGAHNTPAAEEGNDIVSHVKGKYGELLFARWLADKSLTPAHTPFRSDYSRKVDDDDFVVGGVRIEVKAKRRGLNSPFPPALRYNVNMGRRGLEHDVYVFIEVDPRGPIEANPPALIVGWATPRLIQKVGVETWPGKTSDNGDFTFKRYDWDIEIRNLYKPIFLDKQFAAKV